MAVERSVDLAGVTVAVVVVMVVDGIAVVAVVAAVVEAAVVDMVDVVVVVVVVEVESVVATCPMFFMVVDGAKDDGFLIDRLLADALSPSI